MENVAALLGRGLERVLGDLGALGYDAEWHCIPASAVGAPHRRDRVWIVAYANRRGSPMQMGWGRCAGQITDDGKFGNAQWGIESDVGRSLDGFPQWLDRFVGWGMTN